MRFADTIQPDQPGSADGDRQFIGVSQLGEPDTLPERVLWSAVNCDFERRTARSRAGSRTPVFHNAATGTEIFGHGVFSDPINGGEWLLLATAAGVWRSRWGWQPRLIETPVALSRYCTITQAFNTVHLWRGDAEPWVWDGGVTSAFTSIPAPDPASGLSPIPRGPDRRGLRAVTIQNRYAVPHSRTALALSDILDYGGYDQHFADFNITGGNDDVPTALFRYNEGTLLIFNDQSVQRLKGIEPTLTQLILEPVNEGIGCVAGDTVARVGNDVLFLSSTGVFSLSEIESRREVAPVPLTDLIPEDFARVNWQAIGTACACVSGKRYFLALPLDDATAPNAIFPWNSATQQWEGIHELPASVRMDALVALDWVGRKRLHAVDYTTGRVHLLYHGVADVIGTTRTHVPMSLRTRGYSGNPAARSAVRRGQCRVRTWAPNYSASIFTDGVNEEHDAIAARTFSRTRRTLALAADYDQSNANDDYTSAYREDYSLDVAVPFDPDDAGIDPDLMQSHREPFTVNARGAFAQLDITNTEGALELCSVRLETQEADTADIATP